MAGGYPTYVTRLTAIEHIQALREDLIDSLPTERVAPGTGIRHRTVAEPIVAATDRPAYDRAMMDGYAVDANAEYPVSVTEAVYPEDEPPEVSAEAAVEITTGAPLPATANAVIRSEEAEIEDGRLRGPSVEPGEYAYRQGSNVTEGQKLYEPGDRLAARDAVLLDDLDIDAVPVYRSFKVGVLATGTEIAENPRKDRDSNMLLELFDSWGANATYEGAVPDDPAIVEETIRTMESEYDVVVTTGGTSRGAKDYVLEALETLGSIQFHGVQFRPGKSLGVASLDSAVAFAIPGKPFAAYTITAFLLRPFFTGESRLPTLEGQSMVDVGVPNPDFTYAIPATISSGEVVPLGHEASDLSIYGNVFKSSALSAVTRVARADGALLASEPIAAGEQVTMVPYDSLE